MLSREDLEALLAGFQRLPEHRWTVMSTRFDVAA